MVMFAMAMGSVSLMLRERRPNASAWVASLGPPVLTTALAAVHRKGKWHAAVTELAALANQRGSREHRANVRRAISARGAIWSVRSTKKSLVVARVRAS